MSILRSTVHHQQLFIQQSDKLTTFMLQHPVTPPKPVPSPVEKGGGKML